MSGAGLVRRPAKTMHGDHTNGLAWAQVAKQWSVDVHHQKCHGACSLSHLVDAQASSFKHGQSQNLICDDDVLRTSSATSSLVLQSHTLTRAVSKSPRSFNYTNHSIIEKWCATLAESHYEVQPANLMLPTAYPIRDAPAECKVRKRCTRRKETNAPVTAGTTFKT